VFTVCEDEDEDAPCVVCVWSLSHTKAYIHKYLHAYGTYRGKWREGRGGRQAGRQAGKQAGQTFPMSECPYVSMLMYVDRDWERMWMYRYADGDPATSLHSSYVNPYIHTSIHPSIHSFLLQKAQGRSQMLVQLFFIAIDVTWLD
jgi:hypothetical protein